MGMARRTFLLSIALAGTAVERVLVQDVTPIADPFRQKRVVQTIQLMSFSHRQATGQDPEGIYVGHQVKSDLEDFLQAEGTDRVYGDYPDGTRYLLLPSGLKVVETVNLPDGYIGGWIRLNLQGSPDNLPVRQWGKGAF